MTLTMMTNMLPYSAISLSIDVMQVFFLRVNVNANIANPMAYKQIKNGSMYRVVMPITMWIDTITMPPIIMKMFEVAVFSCSDVDGITIVYYMYLVFSHF